MHLGFIGLGNLGKAIAGRLLTCGHSLTVWNRTASKADGLKVEIAESPTEVAHRTEIIFICLFDSHAVHTILTQDNGLLSGDVSGKTIVDLSTNHFKDVNTFHEYCTRAKCTYLEAPVLGSVVPASQGALTILISGSETGYETVKPILEHMGKHLFYLQGPTLATKMKLINNLTLGSFMATIAEALTLGEEVGISKADILDILSVGGGNSLVLNAKKTKLLEEDFSTHFSNALIYKDLHCLQDLAYEQKKSFLTGAIVKELYAKTFEQGIEKEDFSSVYKIFKKDLN
jgi:3-hydroxyisobutyrate dehydrogenase